MKYRIWSNEHRAWWKPARHGYTSLKSQAGIYNEKEAIEICLDANIVLREKEVPKEAMVPVDEDN
jgi:hypothetical protein